MHEIIQASPHVWHIQEVDGTYFSIIRGTRSAILVDAGFGIGDNRAFAEQFLDVPYRLINTHGHIDHVQGDWQFAEAWLHPADLDAYQRTCTRTARISTFFQFAAAYGLPKEKKAAYIAAPETVIHPLAGTESYDLGGVHVQLVHLPGHTKGEIGLLAVEDRLLLSGDAFSDDCFMFADNHDTLEVLCHTLTYALSLPFDSYLGSHTTEPLPQSFLREVLANASHPVPVPGSEEVLLGIPTVTIQYGHSKIRIPAENSR